MSEFYDEKIVIWNVVDEFVPERFFDVGSPRMVE